MKCGKNVLSLWINFFFFNVSMVFWSCSLFWSSFSIFFYSVHNGSVVAISRYCPTFFSGIARISRQRYIATCLGITILELLFISAKIGSTHYIKMLCYHRNNVVCSNLFIFIWCDDILQSLLGKFKGNLFFFFSSFA